MVPLTLFTGFLGAGKTTMLAHLVRERQARGDARPLAIIVNEFATLGLDAVQIPRGDHTVYELNRGSIFCLCLRTDFIALVERIVTELQPDELWVEATGIADTDELFKMLGVPSLRSVVFLRTNICLIDPHTILKILLTLRAAAQQIARADALVVNKTDTCSAAQLAAVEQAVRAHNTHAPLLRARYGVVDMRAIPSFDVPRLDTRPSEGHPPQPLTSVSVCEEWTLDPDALRAWLCAQSNAIWRAKGRVKTPRGMQWLDATLHDIQFAPCPDEYDLPAPTALAFVGPSLSREEILAALSACRSTGAGPDRRG
mgnify:CR=1 FL=1